MGQQTDARLAAFADRTGIHPATGRRRAWLARAKRAAIELYRVLILEESGIRDGDGSWHGSDAVEGQLCAFAEFHAEWLKAAGQPEETTVPAFSDDFPDAVDGDDDLPF